MKLEEILEKKGLEGTESENRRMEEYKSSRGMSKEEKEVLLKELKRMKFKKEEIEEAVGVGIDDMMYTIVPYGKVNEILVAKRGDFIEMPFGYLEKDLRIMKKVYRLTSKKSAWGKRIEEKPGVATWEDNDDIDTKGYILNDHREIEEIETRTPTEKEAELLRVIGVVYRWYKCHCGEASDC